MAVYSDIKDTQHEETSTGLIHTYFGQGAGKSTRAAGLALRAAGAGLGVVFIQFMKSGNSSETRLLQQIPGTVFFCPGRHPFIREKGPEPVHFEHARKSLDRAHQAAGVTDLLICDEILNTLLFGVLKQSQLIDLIKICRGKTELVLTGAAAPSEIISLSDYVTEFVNIRHPRSEGVNARAGIEY